MLLHRAQTPLSSPLSSVDGCAGYRGEDKGVDWVRKTLGWSVDVIERQRKPAPEAVLKSWARE
jgi:hypothetical protein